MTWAATQAKAKFSEVLDKAEAEGPQLVRRRKQEFFVMTRAQHEATIRSSMDAKPFVSGWDALAPSSGVLFEVEFPRSRSKAQAAKF